MTESNSLTSFKFAKSIIILVYLACQFPRVVFHMEKNRQQQYYCHGGPYGHRPSINRGNKSTKWLQQLKIIWYQKQSCMKLIPTRALHCTSHKSNAINYVNWEMFLLFCAKNTSFFFTSTDNTYADRWAVWGWQESFKRQWNAHTKRVNVVPCARRRSRKVVPINHRLTATVGQRRCCVSIRRSTYE